MSSEIPSPAASWLPGDDDIVNFDEVYRLVKIGEGRAGVFIFTGPKHAHVSQVLGMFAS